MATTSAPAAASPSFPVGQFAGVAPFTTSIYAPNSTEGLAFSPGTNTGKNVNGIQPLNQSGILQAVVAEVDTTNLATTATYTAVTETAKFQLFPSQFFSDVKLGLQTSSTLVDISGLGLSIINYFHPSERTAPQNTRLAASTQAASTVSTLQQPAEAVPAATGTTTPEVSASGTAGSSTLDLALNDAGTETLANKFYVTIPASIKFDEYYSFDAGTGALEGVAPAEVVSPQYMATNRFVKVSLKTNPMVNIAEPYAGYAYAYDNGFASADLSFADDSSSSAQLTLYSKGMYEPSGGNLVVFNGNAVAVPAEACTPPIHLWQRQISGDTITIGSGKDYTYPLPQDGQVGLVAFWIWDPSNPQYAPNLVQSQADDIGAWLDKVTFQQSGGQTLFQFSAAAARQWLIEKTGLFVPGVLAFDFWNLEGILSNRNCPNTLLTSAVQVKLDFVSGALSSSAQLATAYDGLQTINVANAS